MEAGASACERSPTTFSCTARGSRRGGHGGKRSPEKSEESGVRDAAGRGALERPAGNFAAQPESR